MKKFLDSLSIWILLAGSLTLGLAPFFPEPHLLQKLGMLFDGSLTKPIDIFDLVMHAAFPALLIAKVVFLLARLKEKPEESKP